MASTLTQMALVAAKAVLVLIFGLAFFPGKGLKGGLLAIGMGVAAAFIIHVVAP